MLAIIAAITSQVVVITGLLYYFGWARTRALYNYFGVDPSLIGFTTTDYLVRSVDSAYPPLAISGLVALALFGVHRWLVVPMLGRRPGHSSGSVLIALVITLRVLGVALVSLVLAGLSFPEEVGVPLGPILPLALVGAACSLGYAGHLRASQAGARLGAQRSSVASRLPFLLLAIGLLGGFWGIALYAQRAGEIAAAAHAKALPGSSDVILYSAKRIAIAGSGIAVDPIAQEASKYQYRYSGLRLLTHTSGKYILVASEWQKGRDRVFLVPDNDFVRADVIIR